MEAIIINNRVTLVDDFSNVKISIVVPARNMQRMVEATSCKVLAKAPTAVHFNNYAGKLFKVTIAVSFKAIRFYMNAKSCHEAENGKDYLALLNEQWPNPCYHQQTLRCDNVNLYAFGDCSHIPYVNNSTIYYAVDGSKRSFINRELNEFGNKRIIKVKGHYYSNRNF